VFILIFKNYTEPGGFPATFKFIKMKNYINYVKEMNRIDPQGIPSMVVVCVVLYLLFWVFPTIVQ
jgi:hypothetical protein